MSAQPDYTKCYDLEQQATLLFEEAEIPLNGDEWQQLGQLLTDSKFDHIIGGDANESHSVWVSRYFNDVQSPQALSALSDKVASIVMSPKMRRFYRQFTGTDKLCLRRCQANRLQKGDYIGIHKDQDSSPDYFATVVFHFDDKYRGGYFQTADSIHAVPSQEQKRYKPQGRMALVNNCSIPHQVTRVESGVRLTLACFLSTSFAANQSQPA
ncbi:MAG: 2OG-Fe(II) oxygenase, partial [Gammaproteobacteria bacterium]|nr:2OG-Fe(II) oxygenase [Gammaproteobacteria bacterium]